MLDVGVVSSAEISPGTDPNVTALASANLFAPPALHAMKLRCNRNSAAGYLWCGSRCYNVLDRRYYIVKLTLPKLAIIFSSSVILFPAIVSVVA